MGTHPDQGGRNLPPALEPASHRWIANGRGSSRANPGSATRDVGRLIVVWEGFEGVDPPGRAAFASEPPKPFMEILLVTPRERPWHFNRALATSRGAKSQEYHCSE
jgi:hypothetical protein